MAKSAAKKTIRFSARVEAKDDGSKVGRVNVYDVISNDDFWGYGIGPKQVAEALEAFEKDGVEELAIHMNSPGGDVFAGAAIHSLLAAWKGKKTIHVDGLCASAAATIAMAGDSIVMGRAAMMMIHNPRGYGFGESAELRKTADRLDSIAEIMAGLYAECSGKSVDEIKGLMSAETWYSAEEAVEAGFADSVAQASDEKEQDEEEEIDEAKARLAPGAFADRVLSTFAHPPANLRDLFGSFRSEAEPAEAEPAVEEKKDEPAAAPVEEKKDPAPAPVEEKKDEPAPAPAPAAEPAATDDSKTTAAASADSVTLRNLYAAIGKNSEPEALAVIVSLKDAATRAEAEKARADALAEEKKKTSIRSMIEDAVRDGRLTPAVRAQVEAPEAPEFMRDPVGLSAFLAALPKQVRTSSEGVREIDHAKDALPLSPDEAHAAHVSRVNPAHIAVFKSGGAAALDELLRAENAAKAKK